MTRGPGETDAGAAPAAKPPACSCPRCAYDLSGHTSTWTTAWPLEGRCSECGLTFEWASLLDSRRRHISWFYEHNPWWSLDKALGTLARVLNPFWFWKRVSVTHPVSPARLVLWPIAAITAVALPLLLVAALSLAAALLAVGRPVPRAAPLGDRVETSVLVAFERGFAAMAYRREDAEYGLTLGNAAEMSGRCAREFALPQAFGALFLIVTAVSPSEWKRRRVRNAHLLRVFVYSLSPAVAVLLAHLTLAMLLTSAWLYELFAEQTLLGGLAGQWPLSSPSSVMWRAIIVPLTHRLADLPGPKTLMILIPCWQVVFFALALRRGLDLPRIWPLLAVASGVGILGQAIAWMASDLLFLYFP